MSNRRQRPVLGVQADFPANVSSSGDGALNLKNNAGTAGGTYYGLDFCVSASGNPFNRPIFQGSGLFLDPTSVIRWSASANQGTGTNDVGLERAAAGVLTVTNGSTGTGDFKAGKSSLTAGTMSRTADAVIRSSISGFSWTNAMITALGAVTAGDIAVCTLPAAVVVRNAYVVITGQAASVTTLTVAVGRVAATYIDYIVASDAKAAVNTIYGDASGERGTNLTGYDFPSFSGTTLINAHFISTGGNLNAVTGSSGVVILETYTLS